VKLALGGMTEPFTPLAAPKLEARPSLPGFDRLYVPQVAWTTGDLDINDAGEDAKRPDHLRQPPSAAWPRRARPRASCSSGGRRSSPASPPGTAASKGADVEGGTGQQRAERMIQHLEEAGFEIGGLTRCLEAAGPAAPDPVGGPTRLASKSKGQPFSPPPAISRFALSFG
jgi:hypothetical protein